MPREDYKWGQKTVLKSAHQLDMVVQTCNLTTQNVEAGGSWVQSYPGLMQRHCFKRKVKGIISSLKNN